MTYIHTRVYISVISWTSSCAKPGHKLRAWCWCQDAGELERWRTESHAVVDPSFSTCGSRKSMHAFLTNQAVLFTWNIWNFFIVCHLQRPQVDFPIFPPIWHVPDVYLFNYFAYYINFYPTFRRFVATSRFPIFWSIWHVSVLFTFHICHFFIFSTFCHRKSISDVFVNSAFSVLFTFNLSHFPTCGRRSRFPILYHFGIFQFYLNTCYLSFFSTFGPRKSISDFYVNLACFSFICIPYLSFFHFSTFGRRKSISGFLVNLAFFSFIYTEGGVGYFSYHVSKKISARIRRLSKSSVGLFWQPNSSMLLQSV